MITLRDTLIEATAILIIAPSLLLIASILDDYDLLFVEKLTVGTVLLLGVAFVAVLISLTIWRVPYL